MNKFSYAPLPFFGGKRTVVADVWARLGQPRQYIEPFCGSAAMLLGARRPASLEVIGDVNFYVANFWRALKYQPEACAVEAGYPVSHIDIAARHAWLTQPERTARLQTGLLDPEWPGDARIAGWWCWGQCCWIGSGWCEKEVSNAGRGIQSKIPHVSDAGRGIQSKIPHVGNAGTGIAAWFSSLSRRLERVRIIHGDWTRCLNHHYGDKDTALFLDPPYRDFERLYSAEGQAPVADAVAAWCAEHPHLRIALCGHRGDYELPGWEVWEWSRKRLTYGGAGTKDDEAVWFSPACAKVARQEVLL